MPLVVIILAWLYQMNNISFLLPHSPDMIFIDEIVSYTNTSIECKATITDNERHLENNKFYTYKCIEIMAQSLGILSSLINKDKTANIGFLLGSRIFNIHKPYLNIGDRITIKSCVSSCDETGFGVYESYVYLNNELYVDARLSVLSPSNSQLEEMINA